MIRLELAAAYLQRPTADGDSFPYGKLSNPVTEALEWQGVELPSENAPPPESKIISCFSTMRAQMSNWKLELSTQIIAVLDTELRFDQNRALDRERW